MEFNIEIKQQLAELALQASSSGKEVCLPTPIEYTSSNGNHWLLLKTVDWDKRLYDAAVVYGLTGKYMWAVAPMCFEGMMPGGDLSAQRTDGSSTMLLSYGMTAVNLTDNNGNKLQLKEGSEATLTFPIPVSMKDNLPASIPLWSFNEKTGLWEEEGLAELKGDVYVGKVKHFSWVNLDEPSDTAWVVMGESADVLRTGLYFLRE